MNRPVARLIARGVAELGPRRVVIETLGGVLALSLVGLFLALAAVML